MIRVETPDHAGSREQAKVLTGTLPTDLQGETVLLDCSRLVIGTPSFLDEIIRQILVLRRAAALEVADASDRARDLLERAATNRDVRERIHTAERTA